MSFFSVSRLFVTVGAFFLFSAGTAQAALADATAQIGGCPGTSGIAAIVAEPDGSVLYAITLRESVISSDGSVCHDPRLILPEDRGVLLASVEATDPDHGLAILWISTGQAIPPQTGSLALPSPGSLSEAIRRNDPVLVIGGSGKTGVPGSTLAAIVPRSGALPILEWISPVKADSGALIVDRNGFLLGLLRGAPGQESEVIPADTIAEFVSRFTDLQAVDRFEGLHICFLYPINLAPRQKKHLLRTFDKQTRHLGLHEDDLILEEIPVADNTEEHSILGLERLVAGARGATLVLNLVESEAADSMEVTLLRVAPEPGTPGKTLTFSETTQELLSPFITFRQERGRDPDFPMETLAVSASMYASRSYMPEESVGILTRALEVTRKMLSADSEKTATSRAGADTTMPPAKEGMLWRLQGDLLWELSLRKEQAGDKAGATRNRTEAIGAYQVALTNLGYDQDSMFWAASQLALGRTYLSLASHQRPLLPMRAIQAFRMALLAFKRSEHPVEWAETQALLGKAFLSLPDRDSPQNLHQAIVAFQNALAALPSETQGLRRARASTLLASSYLELDPESAQQEIRWSIEALRFAEQVWPRSRFPEEWASVQLLLGRAWAMLPAGDRLQNTRRSLERLEAALSVFRRDKYPWSWAMVQCEMGHALALRTDNHPTQNLHEAITRYKAALEILSPEEAALEWALTMSSMGTAMAGLPGDERRKNLEKAVEAFKGALTVLSPTVLPMAWAETQHLLGVVLAQLSSAESPTNLPAAIAAFQEAMTVWTREEFPSKWAATRYQLGLAWLDLDLGERVANLEKAICAFEDVLGLQKSSERSPGRALASEKLSETYLLLVQELVIRGDLPGAIERLQDDPLSHETLSRELEPVAHFLGLVASPCEGYASSALSSSYTSLPEGYRMSWDWSALSEYLESSLPEKRTQRERVAFEPAASAQPAGLDISEILDSRILGVLCQARSRSSVAALSVALDSLKERCEAEIDQKRVH